jgi:hypothetical protein
MENLALSEDDVDEDSMAELVLGVDCEGISKQRSLSLIQV